MEEYLMKKYVFLALSVSVLFMCKATLFADTTTETI